MTNAVELLQHLEGRGHRLTSPRRRILQAISQHEEGFAIEDIYREVRGAGRATIYRTVRLLVETGLICKLALQDGKPLYSLAHAGHHHHAVCLRCGGVTDIYRCGVENLLDNVQAATGGQVLGHRLEVYILCPHCASSQEGP
jgi:Fur family ferric uptake transcriptional regulator